MGSLLRNSQCSLLLSPSHQNFLCKAEATKSVPRQFPIESTHCHSSVDSHHLQGQWKQKPPCYQLQSWVCTREVIKQIMQSDSGLKRSMPCADLNAMGLSMSEKSNNSFESWRTEQSSSIKRQRLSPILVYDAEPTNPATAALEEVLALEDELHFDLETIFTKFPQQSCRAANFGDIMCRKPSMNYKNTRILSAVPEVNDITHVMARLSTTTTA